MSTQYYQPSSQAPYQNPDLLPVESFNENSARSKWTCTKKHMQKPGGGCTGDLNVEGRTVIQGLCDWDAEAWQRHIVDPLAAEARAVFKQHSIYTQAHVLSQQRSTDIIFACHHLEEASRRMGLTSRSAAFDDWVGTMKTKWDEVRTIAVEGKLEREAELESALQSIADHGATLNTAFSLSGVSEANRKLREFTPHGPKHTTTFGDPDGSRSNSTTPDRFYKKSPRLAKYMESLNKSVRRDLQRHVSDTIRPTTQSESKAMQMVIELRDHGILGKNEKPDQHLLWLLERESAMKMKAIALAASQPAEEEDEEEGDDEEEEDEEESEAEGGAEEDQEEEGEEATSSEEEPSSDEEESGDEKPKSTVYAMGGLTRDRRYK